MKPNALIEPLSNRRLFQTTELDEARAIVAGKFCDHRLEIAADANAFDACHHRADGYAVSLNYIRYGADVRIQPGELESFYLIQIPLVGRAEIDNCGGEIYSGKGLGSVLNPHRETKMRWGKGCAQLLLQIDAKVLNKEAERLLGYTPYDPVTFETAVDENIPAIADWVHKLKTCFQLAEQDAAFTKAAPCTQIQVETELVAEFIRRQPSNISDQIVAAPSQINNMHIRRAMQYIQNNLHNPITIADIADASGTSSRSLQLYFKAEKGQTPMRYLRAQRLIFARRLILQSSYRETLGDIAALAGFNHFGRFSAAYHDAFKEFPNQTKQRCHNM